MMSAHANSAVFRESRADVEHVIASMAVFGEPLTPEFRPTSRGEKNGLDARLSWRLDKGNIGGN
jgi:hypothetical protein